MYREDELVDSHNIRDVYVAGNFVDFVQAEEVWAWIVQGPRTTQHRLGLTHSHGSAFYLTALRGLFMWELGQLSVIDSRQTGCCFTDQ